MIQQQAGDGRGAGEKRHENHKESTKQEETASFLDRAKHEIQEGALFNREERTEK